MLIVCNYYKNIYPQVIEMKNQSDVEEFVLLGFPTLPSLQMALFVMFSVIYMSTLFWNILIIITTSANVQLHTPMYFFLCNLSFLEISYISVTIPKMLLNFLLESNSILFAGCAAQMYFFIALGSIECTLLAVMAYDRYVAICNPLQYVTVMNITRCLKLVGSSWLSGFLNSMLHTIFTFRHRFCSSNKINQFFCDIPPLLKVACGDTTTNEIVLFLVGGIYGFGSFLATLISYIHIISTILKIKSKEGQRKAFSTCTSHLIVVTLFFGTSFFTYLKPTPKGEHEQEKLIPVFYAVITPTLNPIIYTLRNKEFKSVLRKMCMKELGTYKY
ncbi:olfactory receptor 5V1-like [Spea bombifrons]|uniref:olfactory receptor 5V1-like n=1 Tax=Spea bombifrons TaxID=233779 RepID=UPI00234BAE9B|nr:olfactory receptor 5V1-like [Spea bombifrons]